MQQNVTSSLVKGSIFYFVVHKTRNSVYWMKFSTNKAGIIW